jgi:hypothetical protein
LSGGVAPITNKVKISIENSVSYFKLSFPVDEGLGIGLRISLSVFSIVPIIVITSTGQKLWPQKIEDLRSAGLREASLL